VVLLALLLAFDVYQTRERLKKESALEKLKAIEDDFSIEDEVEAETQFVVNLDIFKQRELFSEIVTPLPTPTKVALPTPTPTPLPCPPVGWILKAIMGNAIMVETKSGTQFLSEGESFEGVTVQKIEAEIVSFECEGGLVGVLTLQ